jgi:hypothetical protein
MPPPILPPVKRGDSFELSCVYKEEGVATSVAAMTIKSQVRDATGSLVADLTATKPDQGVSPGQFTLSVAAPIEWPVGIMSVDIEFSDAGVVRSTQTFKIPVEDDITK